MTKHALWMHNLTKSNLIKSNTWSVNVILLHWFIFHANRYVKHLKALLKVFQVNISHAVFSKNCLNRHQYNLFPCVIGHFHSSLSNFLYVFHRVIWHLVYCDTKLLSYWIKQDSLYSKTYVISHALGEK